MPWHVGDVDKYNSGLTRQQKRTWVNIANSVLKSCQKSGGKDCDAKAIQQANGVILRQKEKAMTAKKAAEAKITKGSVPPPASAIQTIEDQKKTPDIEAAEKTTDLNEWGGDFYPSVYVAPDVMTFDQLEDAEEADEVMRAVQVLTDKYFTLTRNVLYSSESNRLQAMQTLTGEFMTRLGMILEDEAPESPPEMGDDEAQVVQSESGEPISESEKLCESDAGQIVNLSEIQGQGEVLRLDIAIIRPGWGNNADNHFYPREMLSQYAERFVNAKMYETDHRAEEKSTRTWVSTLTEIVGFTEDGAPIGRVIVHDPGFAARIRNLAEAKLLEKMECSILATGRATPFELDGVKGKRVTEIVEVESVDWVTRAGAGGKALNLAESVGGNQMEVDNEKLETTPEVPAEVPAEIPAETTAENNQDDPIQEETPEFLGEAEITRIITASSLPEISKRRVSQGKYQDEKSLQEAISGEIAYLKEATGSGQVVEMGEASKPKAKQYDPVAVAEAADRVNKKYLGGYNG